MDETVFLIRDIGGGKRHLLRVDHRGLAARALSVLDSGDQTTLVDAVDGIGQNRWSPMTQSSRREQSAGEKPARRASRRRGRTTLSSIWEAKFVFGGRARDRVKGWLLRVTANEAGNYATTVKGENLISTSS